jgi:hypothetical protein
MSDLPPEVATARVLLRRTAPLPGSQGRIYSQVLASQPHRRRTGIRAATVAFCVAASTSAMAFGYRWVTHREAVALHPEAQLQTSPLASQVQRRQKIGSPVSRAVDAKETAAAPPDSIVPTATSSNTRPTVTPHNVSHSGLQRSVSATDPTDVASSVAPAMAVESELRQQVREYREAVAAMRANPKLALDKLLAYRVKWRNSAIAQEVDLRVIEALTALGRHHEAANAARTFVQNYPDSAHLAPMRRIADAAPVPND